MAATRKPRQKTPAPARHLLEWAAAAPTDGPALDIDRTKKVVFGVRVLGRYSRNGHGLKEAVNGTEYPPATMRDALPLYEGAQVLSGHAKPRDRKNGGNDDLIGVLRNVRLDDGGIRGDLHYFDSHPMSARLLEDVERKLGVLGLSHDVYSVPGLDRVDRRTGRLTVGRLARVDSVDLVRNPASATNLWESQETAPVTKTLRELLESLTLSKPRQKWRKRLLEDDMPGMDEPMADPPAEDADPDEALWAGFKAAIMAILDGDATAEEKASKIGKYIKAHAKLAGDAEPDEPAGDDSDWSDASAETEPEKKESLTPAEKQELGVRRLCEELKVAPSKGVLAAAIKLPTLKDARELLESLPAGGTGARPRSPGHPGGGGAAAKPAAVPTDAKGFGASVRDDR